MSGLHYGSIPQKAVNFIFHVMRNPVCSSHITGGWSPTHLPLPPTVYVLSIDRLKMFVSLHVIQTCIYMNWIHTLQTS